MRVVTSCIRRSQTCTHLCNSPLILAPSRSRHSRAKDESATARFGKSDIAVRYALWELNPFAVLGAGYFHFNGNGALDIVDPNTGTGVLTVNWIDGRSEMLYWHIVRNRDDVPGVVQTLVPSPYSSSIAG
jgi:hypothetical protein